MDTERPIVAAFKPDGRERPESTEDHDAMKKLIIAACALALTAPVALADSKPTDDEAAKITATLEAWGCKGGEFEKETEGSGVFEIDDTTCKDGKQYDIKLDSEFNLIAMTRD